jgi:hypothetical protein
VINIARRTAIRLSAFALIVLALGQAPARADVIQLTTILPPPTGAYTLPSFVCITAVCFSNIVVSGFVNTSDVFAGGNEMVDTNAVFVADVFQNHLGSPGASLGPLSTPGTMNFTYFDRTDPGQLGTFRAAITNFDFMGTFNAHPFEFRQNPDMVSVGETTITQAGGGREFRVTSFFDVFAELSLNNGPFVPGPERAFTLTTVPEPASMQLVLCGLIGLARAVRMRRRT